MKDYRKALVHLKKALALKPDHAKAKKIRELIERIENGRKTR
jgi:hypothetical protein